MHRTRSNTGSLPFPTKRTTGVDVDRDGSNDTQNVALEGEGLAANYRNNNNNNNNNNNDRDNEHQGDDAEDNESSPQLRRSSRQFERRGKSYNDDGGDDDDDDDDDDGVDDDASNMSDGSAQQKKKRKNKTRSLATTLYNAEGGWVFRSSNSLSTSLDIIVKRTKLYYELGMDDPENYGSIPKWSEFREKAAEEGLYELTSRYDVMKKFYNQNKIVAKGEYPDQPLPLFQSVDDVVKARRYCYHSGRELIRKVEYLKEFAILNELDEFIIPDNGKDQAVKILTKLAEGGDPLAIEWLDFVYACISVRISAATVPDGPAAHLLDMLKKIGCKDHSSIHDYEEEHLEHGHQLFLRAALGEDALLGELRQVIDPQELRTRIQQTEKSDYLVTGLVCGEIKDLTFGFSKQMYDGNEDEVEELYRKDLLSKGEHRGRGWVKFVYGKGKPKCADCGKESYICGALDHNGPGAVKVKSLRGGKHPFECSEKELKLQEKLFAIEREKGNEADWRFRCTSCHHWKDVSISTRIIAGVIDRKSDDAGSWKHSPSQVAKMDAIHRSRIDSHKDDAWSGEELELIKSSRDNAHHVTGSYETLLDDLDGGGLWALDTAKRQYETSSYIIKYSADKLVQRQARRNVVTASTDSNYHKILHRVIDLVERGLLNGGILPFEIRGGYFIVPVSPSVNSGLYKILVDYRSSFEEIADRVKVMSSPRQSFIGGHILKELETDYSDNDAAQDDNDECVPMDKEQSIGANFGDCKESDEVDACSNLPSPAIANNKRVFSEINCAADEEQVRNRRGNGPNGARSNRPETHTVVPLSNGAHLLVYTTQNTQPLQDRPHKRRLVTRPNIPVRQPLVDRPHKRRLVTRPNIPVRQPLQDRPHERRLVTRPNIPVRQPLVERAIRFVSPVMRD